MRRHAQQPSVRAKTAVLAVHASDAMRTAYRSAKHEIALNKAIGSFGSPNTMDDFMRSPKASSLGSFDTTRYRVLRLVSAID